MSTFSPITPGAWVEAPSSPLFTEVGGRRLVYRPDIHITTQTFSRPRTGVIFGNRNHQAWPSFGQRLPSRLRIPLRRPVDNDVRYWDWEYLLAFIRDPTRYPRGEGPSVWRIEEFIERDKIGGCIFVTTLTTNEIFESGDPRKTLFRAIRDVLPPFPIMSPLRIMHPGLRDIWEGLDLATAANVRVEPLLLGVEPEMSDWDWGDTQIDEEAQESSLTPSQIASPTYGMEMIQQMEEEDVQDDHSLTEEVSESDIDSDSPSEYDDHSDDGSSGNEVFSSIGHSMASFNGAGLNNFARSEGSENLVPLVDYESDEEDGEYNSTEHDTNAHTATSPPPSPDSRSASLHPPPVSPIYFFPRSLPIVAGDHDGSGSNAAQRHAADNEPEDDSELPSPSIPSIMGLVVCPFDSPTTVFVSPNTPSPYSIPLFPNNRGLQSRFGYTVDEETFAETRDHIADGDAFSNGLQGGADTTTTLTGDVRSEINTPASALHTFPDIPTQQTEAEPLSATEGGNKAKPDPDTSQSGPSAQDSLAIQPPTNPSPSSFLDNSETQSRSPLETAATLASAQAQEHTEDASSTSNPVVGRTHLNIPPNLHLQDESDRQKNFQGSNKNANANASTLSPLNINLSVLDTGRSLLQEVLQSPVFTRYTIPLPINIPSDHVRMASSPEKRHTLFINSSPAARRADLTRSLPGSATRRTLFPIDDSTRGYNTFSSQDAPSRTSCTRREDSQAQAPAEGKGKSVAWASSSRHHRRMSIDNSALVGSTSRCSVDPPTSAPYGRTAGQGEDGSPDPMRAPSQALVGTQYGNHHNVPSSL